MVTNPACGELNSEKYFSRFPFAPGNLVSRDRFGCPAPHPPAQIHRKAKYGAYSRAPFFPPASTAIGSILTFSGHEKTYRWRSPPGVPRHSLMLLEVARVTGVPNQLMCAPFFPYPLLTQYVCIKLHITAQSSPVVSWSFYALCAISGACIYTGIHQRAEKKKVVGIFSRRSDCVS